MPTLRVSDPGRLDLGHRLALDLMVEGGEHYLDHAGAP